jgi:cell division septal protein FtsQ
MQKPARRNSVLNSPRIQELKRKKRKVLVRKVLIFTFLFLILVTILFFTSRIKRLNISGVTVEGNKVIDTESIETAVRQEISGSYLWLFPKSNILLYPKNKIKLRLGNQFKRLTDINVSMEGSQTLAISVGERTPEYTWCGNTLVLDGGKEICYFLDKDGYIFDVAPYFSGEVYFKFYESKNLDNGSASGSYIAPGYFDKLILFKNTLVEMGLKPVVLNIEDSGNIKIYLSKVRTLGMGPEIIIKKDSDFQKIAENLKAALDTEPLLSKFKKEYSSLEYIDLRFGNKVYYRFR